MRSKPAVPPASPPDARDTPSGSERDQISQNIEAVLEFYTREELKITRSQRILERISRFVGQPVFSYPVNPGSTVAVPRKLT